MTTCPTCGQPVRVVSSDEGTHHYAAPPDVELRDALEDMVRQFACWSNVGGGYSTCGLSALEDAFGVLGWDDPRPAPEARCDEPGCMKQRTMGTPTPGGYRSTCHDHQPGGRPIWTP